ncbi:MAG: hypothetical protein ACOY9Y_02220 [Bacillota bacterium]
MVDNVPNIHRTVAKELLLAIIEKHGIQVILHGPNKERDACVERAKIVGEMYVTLCQQIAPLWEKDTRSPLDDF